MTVQLSLTLYERKMTLTNDQQSRGLSLATTFGN